MKERKNYNKRSIRCPIAGIVVILLAVSYFPVKMAVYADKDDEKRFSNQGVLDWYFYDSEHMKCILETSDLTDRPKLRQSGVKYIGDRDSSILPAYYAAQEFKAQGHYVPATSPLLKLNSNFDPSRVTNFFAVTYEEVYWLDIEEKEDCYIVPIRIYQWTPVYPIQRSGTLARMLLPKGYLTIWDFIGKSAMNTGD